jgi:DNA-damage-inducible protein J
MKQDKIMAENSTSMVHVRVDDQVKLRATEALAKMGLSVSDAVRVLLIRVAADQAFPFPIKVPVPNAETAKAIKELNDGKGKRFSDPAALFADLGI